MSVPVFDCLIAIDARYARFFDDIYIKTQQSCLIKVSKNKGKIMKRGATVAIFNDDQTKIVMLKREDFRVWCLPGGGVDDGESFAEGAIREAFEETGYEVEIINHVGDYRRPQFDEQTYLFSARVIGGEAIESGPETLAVDWFPVNELPERQLPNMELYVNDALQFNGEPIQREIRFSIGFMILAKTLIALRDFRNKLFRRQHS